MAKQTTKQQGLYMGLLNGKSKDCKRQAKRIRQTKGITDAISFLRQAKAATRVRSARTRKAKRAA